MSTNDRPLAYISDTQLLEVASNLNNLTSEELLQLQEEYIFRRQYTALEITANYVRKNREALKYSQSFIDGLFTKELSNGNTEKEINEEFYQRGLIDELPILEEPETTPEPKPKRKSWLKSAIIFVVAYLIAQILYYLFF